MTAEASTHLNWALVALVWSRCGLFLPGIGPNSGRLEAGTVSAAVMLTSGDLDTRVPPLQARKMTARLHNATSSGLPVILRYHEKAGHAAGGGLPVSHVVEDRAAELTFLLTQLGVTGSE